MSSTLLEGLIETRQIGDLLDDVASDETPPVAPVVESPRQPLGGLPIGSILKNVNWMNRPRYSWPLVPDSVTIPAPAEDGQWERFETPVAALPLRQFLATVHWTNSGEAPSRPTFAAVGVAPKPVPVATVESVLAEFAWE
jgi:hypothetical protein